MKRNQDQTKNSGSSAVFKIGSVSLVFLVIGYQAALFINRAAILSIEAHRDRPDTVYITRYIYPELQEQTDVTRTQSSLTHFSSSTQIGASEHRVARQETLRVTASHSDLVNKLRESTRKVESFRFDPNSVSLEDLCRLGFSSKQAQSIINYRQKGGRFRRKSDFARSFVVSDSVYRRLEPYIEIARIDINTADSAAFDALSGIGPYYAARMIEHRQRLGGYSYVEQLMDIRNFDSIKFAAIADQIYCSQPQNFALWTMDAESLRTHPYIGNATVARAIVLYRQHTPRDQWSVEGLRSAGILSDEAASKLGRCRIESVQY